MKKTPFETSVDTIFLTALASYMSQALGPDEGSQEAGGAMHGNMPRKTLHAYGILKRVKETAAIIHATEGGFGVRERNCSFQSTKLALWI